MLILGDCLEKMKEMADNSVDAIVTDAPYGLAFMGKKWDYDVPSVAIWNEIFRILKPGGHIVSFGGTRTYHRLACNIEDAGFEIRDQIQWIYGSGFPKSHDVSKAIDKADIRANNFSNSQGKERLEIMKSVPNSDAAKQWQGWGSALKPANEPICLARKPLSEKTLALNVTKWGTGAINIDDCRVEAADQGKLEKNWDRTAQAGFGNGLLEGALQTEGFEKYKKQGRWPANLILGCMCEFPPITKMTMHDEECPIRMLDEQSGNRPSAGEYKKSISEKETERSFLGQPLGLRERKLKSPFPNEQGGASRFFYCAKASKAERNAGLYSSDLIWEAEAWLKPDLSLLTENILRLAKDTSEGTLMGVNSWSTELSGLKLTEQSLTALIFTIKTVLKLIIDLRILNASQNLSIKENIQDAIKTIEANGLNLAESAEFLNQSNLNTTHAKTVLALGAVVAALPMLLKIKSFAKSGNFHNTVKPIKLMAYLCRLITPPKGIVLDPFMGSGSTGVAAKQEGFKFIGIEMNEEYFEIAKKRISTVESK